MILLPCPHELSLVEDLLAAGIVDRGACADVEANTSPPDFFLARTRQRSMSFIPGAGGARVQPIPFIPGAGGARVQPIPFTPGRRDGEARVQPIPFIPEGAGGARVQPITFVPEGGSYQKEPEELESSRFLSF